MTDSRDMTTRWAWRAGALAALLLGWVFIAWQNRFHITAPVVFVCLGYLAVITTVYNLWRTGAAVVESADAVIDSTWSKPVGAVGELEREKRTLLKAIKEAEFDHEMGKLSKRDADDMIRQYRGRAIEVIKEIEQLGQGAAGTPREQIMREVRARLEVSAKSQKRPAKPEGKIDAKIDAKIEGKTEAKIDAKAANGKAKQPPAPAAADASGEAQTAESSSGPSPAAAAAVADAEAVAATEAAAAKVAATRFDDDTMNADSTTSIEPRHDAKEATP